MKVFFHLYLFIYKLIANLTKEVINEIVTNEYVTKE